MTSTKGYKNNTLETLTKKLNKQVYSLQKQCSLEPVFEPVFEPVLTSALDIGIAKSP